MNYPAKQELYRTAYNPMFEVVVQIDKAYQDDVGGWIFKVSSDYAGAKVRLTNHLCREHELTNFVL